MATEAAMSPVEGGHNVGRVAPVAAASDPGFYLISDGRPALERALGLRVPRSIRLRRAYLGGATFGFLASLAVVTALVLAIPLALSASNGFGIALAITALLAVVPASDVGVAIVNRAVTNLLGPRALPRFELAGGVPTDLRTLVVVPTLLTSVSDVAELVENLEIHYLANPEGDVRFALLSDWLDADVEVADEDDELLATATRPAGARDSSCSIGSDAGTRQNVGGWAGNGSAGSSTI